MPTSRTQNSEFDEMFNGLGLGSYVSGRASASTIATGGYNSESKPLNLAEKQKIVRESQVKMTQIQPMSMSNSQSQAKKQNSVDLTSTLMAKNLNQMSHSQTLANFQPNTMTNAWPNPVKSQPPKPDLSAFDTLLPVSKSGNKVPMNSLVNSTHPPINSGNFTSMAFSGALSSNQNGGQSQSNIVKSLTASDISDLLS